MKSVLMTNIIFSRLICTCSCVLTAYLEQKMAAVLVVGWTKCINNLTRKRCHWQSTYLH